jgi:hypothetical protein
MVDSNGLNGNEMELHYSRKKTYSEEMHTKIEL